MATPSMPGAAGATPSDPRTAAAAPPNFYAQAASAQPAPKPDYSIDNQKFRLAIDKLMKAFDYLEKLRPNGQDIAPEVKAMAQSLKVAEKKAFGGGDEPDMDVEGAGGEGGQAGGQAGAAAGQGSGTGTPGGAAGPRPLTPTPGGMGA